MQGESIRLSVQDRHHAENQSEYQYKTDNMRRINQNISERHIRDTQCAESIKISLQYKTDNMQRTSQIISERKTMCGESFRISLRERHGRES